MNGKTYQTTIIVRGDNRDGVRTVQLTRSELEKLTGAQNKNLPVSQRLTQAFSRANTSVGRLTTGLQGLGGLLGAIGLGAFVRKTMDSADSLASMRGQLKLVTDSQEELNQVYDRALALSNETGAATESTVNLYARMARSTEELNLSQEQLFTITKAVNQSFVVSGATAQESSSAILQLSQGLAAGALRGEELNSVMENSPRLARALADGLGVSIGQLREMGKAGDLTAEAVTGALLDMAGEIDGEFQEMPMTISRAMQSMTNSVNDALGDVDTQPLTENIVEFQQLLADPAFRQSVGDLAGAVIRLTTGFAGALSEGTRFARFLGEELARRLHGAAFDDVVGMQRELDKLEKQMERTRVKSTAGYREMSARARELRRYIALAAQEQERAASVAREKASADNVAAEAAQRQAVAVQEQREQTQRLAQIGFTAASSQLALADATKIASQDMAAAAASANTAQQALQDLGREADPVAAAIERGGERMDDAFAGFFRDMIREGKFSFDSLKDLALDTLGEIIYAYTRNKVILSLGLGGGGMGFAGSAAAAGAGGGLFSGGMSGVLSAFGGGVTNLLQGGAGFLQNIGFDSGARFFTGLENNLAISGGGSVALGTLGNLGAGIAGNLLGNQLFGPTSGIGSTIGGLAGSFIPIPFVGTALGSLLGSGIEALFGGGKPSQNFTSVRFASGDRPSAGLSAGGFNQFDTGTSETTAAAMDIVDTLNQFRNLLGGSNQDVVFNVGDQNGLYLGDTTGRGASGGPNFNGYTFNYGDDAEGFLLHAFQQMVTGADQLGESLQRLILDFDGTLEQTTSFTAAWMSIQDSLDFDAVGQAVQDFTLAQDANANTMMAAYRRTIDGAQELARNYDGSAEAAQVLAQGLNASKQATYEMATAILMMNDQIAAAAETSAQQIRESVMTDEQRLRAWTGQRDDLRVQLETLADPDKITEVSQEILRLNRQIFDSLGEDAQRSQAEAFAQYAENTAEIAAEQYDAALQDVREADQRLASEVSQILTGAAQQQQRSAETFASAVALFNAAIDALVNQGIRINTNSPRFGSEVNV